MLLLTEWLLVLIFTLLILQLVNVLLRIAKYDYHYSNPNSKQEHRYFWKKKMNWLVVGFALMSIWFTFLGFAIGSQTKDTDLIGVIPNLLGHWLVAAFVNMINIVSLVCKQLSKQ